MALVSSCASVVGWGVARPHSKNIFIFLRLSLEFGHNRGEIEVVGLCWGQDGGHQQTSTNSHVSSSSSSYGGALEGNDGTGSAEWRWRGGGMPTARHPAHCYPRRLVACRGPPDGVAGRKKINSESDLRAEGGWRDTERRQGLGILGRGSASVKPHLFESWPHLSRP